jgi:hypothetical protein
MKSKQKKLIKGGAVTITIPYEVYKWFAYALGIGLSTVLTGASIYYLYDNYQRTGRIIPRPVIEFYRMLKSYVANNAIRPEDIQFVPNIYPINQAAVYPTDIETGSVNSNETLSNIPVFADNELDDIDYFHQNPDLSSRESSGKGLKSRKPNKWVEFVKSYAKKNKMNYFQALKDPRCKELYRKKN